jgi:acyl carrier protein
MAGREQLAQFDAIGNHGLDPDQAVNVLERLLSDGIAQAMVADVDWPRFRAAYEARRARPIVRDLRNERPRRASAAATPTTAVTRSASRVPAASPWIATMTATPQIDREATLANLLRREAAATLGFDRADEVPVDRRFSSLGMDSLMMADFIGRLGKHLGVSCTALVFEHPTVGTLAPRLLETLGPVFVTEPAHATETSRPAAPTDVAPVQTNAIDGYSPEVEAEAFAFQAQAWPQRRRDLIAPRWRWMFVESARRLGLDPRVWLARDEGRVVGHMGAIPVRLKLGSAERHTAWLVDTMVVESHRASALGSRLMVQAYEDLPFALSLGQTAEMRTILVRLGWKQVAPLQTAQLLIRPEKVLKGKLPSPVAWAAGLGVTMSAALHDALRDRVRFESREVGQFNEEHDLLWQRVSRDIGCGVVRDASYLNWKYVDQPGQEFVRLEMRDNHTLVGSAVLMFREPDRDYQYHRAFLVDLVAPLSNGALLRPLVRAVAAAAEERGAHALICMHVNAALTATLRACGFLLREPTRFLVVSPGDVEEPALSQLLSADSWFVTQGDSDIDRPW